MANKVFQVTSGDLFKFDPDDLMLSIPDERSKIPVLESRVLDIMARGVIVPVVVGKGDDGLPFVIDGRQRVKAAREAKKRLLAAGSTTPFRIPATYRKGDDLGNYLSMISANEHRQDDGPMEKAKKLERALALGSSEEEAAISFGVSLQTIKNWGKLLNLAPEVKAAVNAGKVGATAAGKLADLPKAEQAEKLATLTEEGHKPTVRRAVKVAKNKAPDGQKMRVRSRGAIEMAIAHNTNALTAMDGLKALWWALGKDVEGLGE